MSDLHHLLKEQRKQAGLTQRWLGLQLGLNQQTVFKIESGKRSISFEEGVRWSRVTGGSIDALAAAVEDVAPSCDTCHGDPPEGFVCGECGRCVRPPRRVSDKATFDETVDDRTSWS